MAKNNGESRLRIVIEAKNMATGELKKMASELRGLGQETEKASAKQKGLIENLKGVKASTLTAVAGITAAGLAVKKALDFGVEGASILRLQTATTSLARSMGGNMDDIVNAIRNASGGTVSDFSIMQAAGRAMMLGLGSDADKLANLMQVAMFRGRAMGLSGEQAFSDIVTGVGRLSPMILDNLGIVLDADKTYQDYAATLGKTADALTSAEKRQALLNRVLEEGNKMIAEAGGVADDAATPFERLGAAFANMANQVKTGLGEGLAPAADWLAKVIDPVGTAKRQFSGMSEAVAKTSVSYVQYRRNMIEAAYAAGLEVDNQGRLVKMMASQQGMIPQIIDANYMWGESFYKIKMGIDDIPDDSFVEKAKRMQDAAKGASMTMEDLAVAMRGEVGKETKRYATESKRTEDQIKKVVGELAALGVDPGMSEGTRSQLFTKQSQYGNLFAQIRGLEKDAGVSAGTFNPQANLYENLKGMGIDDGTIEQVSKLNEQIGVLYKQITDLGGKPYLTEEQKQQVVDLQQQLGDLQGQQKDQAVEHRKNMDQMIFDMTKEKLMRDGLQAGEEKFLIEFAQKRGLVDQETAALWETTGNLADQVSAASQKAEDLGTKVEDLPEYKKIQIELEAIGDVGILTYLSGGAVVKGKLGANGGSKDMKDYATGGSFIVPGSGGIDSAAVAFHATPGEHVEITPAGKRPGSGSGGGGVTLKNYGTIIVSSLDEVGFQGSNRI